MFFRLALVVTFSSGVFLAPPLWAANGDNSHCNPIDQAPLEHRLCNLSHQISGPARWLNDRFAKQDQEEQTNGHLRLRMHSGPVWHEQEDWSLQSGFSGSWAIPNLEERVKIRITGSQRTVRNDPDNPASQGGGSTDTEFGSGIGILVSSVFGDLSSDAVWSEGQVVLRTRLEYPLVKRWHASQAGAVGQLNWNSVSSFGYFGQLFYDWQPNSDYRLGADVSLDGDFDPHSGYVGQRVYLSTPRNDFRINWVLGRSQTFDSELVFKVQDSWLGLSVGRAFNVEGLSWEISPSVHFPREYDYQRTHQLVFRIKAVLDDRKFQ